MLCALTGVRQGTTVSYRSKDGRKIVTTTGFDCLPDTISLLRRSMLHDVNQGQGRLTFCQVIAQAFTGISFST